VITVKIFIADFIIPIGVNVAGEMYHLECSIGTNDQPVFTWLDPADNPVPSEMINTTDSVSTLVFSPLAASHAGTYTCIISLEGVSYNETMIITVNGMCLMLYP
jgi:hypothetical protein